MCRSACGKVLYMTVLFPYLLLHCLLELLYPMSSVVETQRDWVFMLAQTQDIPELLYKC